MATYSSGLLLQNSDATAITSSVHSTFGIDFATFLTCTRSRSGGTPSEYRQSWLLRSIMSPTLRPSARCSARNLGRVRMFGRDSSASFAKSVGESGVFIGMKRDGATGSP